MQPVKPKQWSGYDMRTAALKFDAVSSEHFEPRAFEVYTERHLDRIQALELLTNEQRFEMQVVASVLPFRVNRYVIDELIDWRRVPDDPIFQLTFPQKGMLSPADFDRMAGLHRSGADKQAIQQLANEIRARLNPHPAGQLQMNLPKLNGDVISGLQHKYRQTVLYFPAQGQTCHSYCTFCFRWAQFVGDKELRIASREADTLSAYLREHREVSDLLITGGDPMVMKTKNLKAYLEPLLTPELAHVQTVRIGTKALTFWP